MKQTLLLLSLFLCLQNISASINTVEEDITVTFPDDFTNGWDQYIGQTVVFAQKLYMCGQYGSEFYLSNERLMNPGETASIGSEEYNALKAKNKASLITATGSGLTMKVRLGNYVENVRAYITGKQQMDILNSYDLRWTGNEQLTQYPDLGNANLIVCATNLENFFTTLGKHGAQNQENYNRQFNKIINALTNINADIYGVAEVEEGSEAISALVEGLNQNSSSGDYAYVFDDNTTSTFYTKVGFIYRTDKVEPVLELGHPQNSNVYYKRMYVQAFNEKETGERFVFSMNHFKAQNTDPTTGEETTGAVRLSNAQNLTRFLANQQSSNYYNDPDILIMGDLNSYTKDYPIMHIADAGYINELTKHDPGTYSHVFDNEAGCLDHVFASESMDKQITGAAVYHINCDEYYRYAYKYYDFGNSMYRYSDHDPVVVGLRLNPGSSVNKGIDFSESFNNTLGAFKEYSVTGTRTWEADSYGYVKINGYNDGENEDWLISPAFDLTNMKDATLKFEQAINFSNNEQMQSENTLWATNEVAAGVPTTETWTQIIIPTYPSGSNWNWVTNSDIQIPKELFGDNFRFAFRYTCPSNRASAWDLKNLRFKANPSETDINTTSIIPKFNVYSSGKDIIIEGADGTDNAVFNVTGQCIAVQKDRITVPGSGIYLVRINNEIHKIVIK